MKEDLAENNNAANGSITLKGTVINGNFLVDKEAEGLRFGENGNISFVVEGDMKMKDYNLLHPGCNGICFWGSTIRQSAIFPFCQRKIGSSRSFAGKIVHL